MTQLDYYLNLLSYVAIAGGTCLAFLGLIALLYLLSWLGGFYDA